jgi:hypothetical protein
MRIEWAMKCREVQESPSGVDAFGLDRGYTYVGPLPVMIPVPVVICFRLDPGDAETGGATTVHYRVLDPSGTVTDADSSALRWSPSSAPQLVDPERVLKIVHVPFRVDGSGQHAVELWVDNGAAFKIPCQISTFQP